MKHKPRPLLKIFFGLSLLVFSAGLLFASYIFSLDAWDNFDSSKITGAPETLIIYDKDSAEVCRLHKSEDRVWVSIDKIAPIAQKAFVSAEDARFYDHIGVDFIRIVGAAIEDIKQGSYVEGASTISQQLIKLSHLTPDKTFERKIEEAIMSYCMEQQFDKNGILEMYLNYVYFGNGFYGIEAASLGYFGIHASELDASHAAMLAGIVKSPSRYAPHTNYEKSIERRDTVLRLMNEYGHIDDEQYAQAKAQSIVIQEDNDIQRRGYYIDAALNEAAALLDMSIDELLESGYRINTSMDSDLQSYIEKLVQDGDLLSDDSLQTAMVLMDSHTGEVLAILGGRETDRAMAFNRATSMRRQPGSVIKPIICYAPALESYGYTAATLFKDEPKDFDGYSPKNSGEKYYGTVTLRKAVTSSLNIPAVEVLNNIGVENGKSFAKKFGIEFDERDQSLALALGGFTYGVSPIMVARAYACFSNGGYYTGSSFVTSIYDRFGNLIYERVPRKTYVMSESNAYILTSMLESAITNGTGKRLNDLGMELAGKTGTVGSADGNRDAWMACYNSEISAVVWMGYDDDSVGLMPSQSTGGNYPALMLHDVLSYMYKDREAPRFEVPSDVIMVRLDSQSLAGSAPALANAFTPNESVFEEVFVKGTEPTATSQFWQIPEPPDDLRCLSSGNASVLMGFSAKLDYVLYRLYRSDQNGVVELLNTFEGRSGFVTFSDDGIAPGVYHYYVVPVHSVMRILDREVTGPASERVEVVVP